MAGRARIPIALFLLVASACTIPNLHEARRAAPALPQTSYLYVGNADTLSRKLKEAVLAWQLEGKLSKEQILRKYLNTVYFGNGAYGVEAAAQTYFGEPASDLTLGQAALLAGMIRAPVDFDPITHPTHARQRRNHVLQLMYDLGSIDLTTLQDALRKPVHLHQNPQDSS